jgi:hypothetical protein
MGDSTGRNTNIYNQNLSSRIIQEIYYHDSYKEVDVSTEIHRRYTGATMIHTRFVIISTSLSQFHRMRCKTDRVENKRKTKAKKSAMN